MSGSMAGHCRMKIWFAAHQYQPEAVPAKVQRIFDMGHLVETACFDGIRVFDPQTQTAFDIGPWWPSIGWVEDPVTGEGFDTSELQIHNRQEEVSVDGFVGHLDGITRFKGGFLNVDAKSMPGRSFDAMRKKNLYEDVFAREYVAQQNFYMEGKRLAGGVEVPRSALLCFNKENSDFMLRFIDYDPKVVADLRERLAWAKSGPPPEPEWEWVNGEAIPLRCGYCDFRNSCAAFRGVALAKKSEKGSPKWIVSQEEGKC